MSFEVPAGKFENCLQIYFSNNCETKIIEYLAQDVVFIYSKVEG